MATDIGNLPATESPVSELHPESAARRGLTAASTAAAAEVVIAAGVIVAACYFGKLLFIVLLVSTLLSFILAPICDFGERLLRLPRSVAAGLAVFLLVACIGGVVYYGYNQAQNFARDLPKYSGKIHATLSKYARRAQELQKTTETVLPSTDGTPEGDGNNTTAAPNTTAGTANNKNNSRSSRTPPPQQQTVVVQQPQQNRWTDYITRSLGPISEVVLAIGFIPFLVYFMLSWQEHVRSSTVMLFKMENRNTAYVTIGAISKMIRMFIVGNVIVGLFMGGVATLVFGILGVPYFYFVGMISGFVSLIPYLGVVLAIVPPILADIGQLNGTGVLWIVLTVVLLHIFSLNVLYPKIVGARVQLNPLAVTMALLVWGFLWGAMGLILAVPVTA